MTLAVLEEVVGTPVGTARVTPAMLKAGRAVFKRERGKLSDLYEHFPCDLDEFITAVYQGMAGAAR